MSDETPRPRADPLRQGRSAGKATPKNKRISQGHAVRYCDWAVRRVRCLGGSL